MPRSFNSSKVRARHGLTAILCWLAIALSGGLGCALAKPSLPFHVGYAFSQQGAPLNSPMGFDALFTCEKDWDAVELKTETESLSAPVAGEGKTGPSIVMIPGEPLSSKRDELPAPDNLKRYKLPMSVQVAQNGEYVIKLSFRFTKEGRAVGTYAGQLGVYAAGGKVWLGPESPEQALVQSLKAELGIKGEPVGADLERLNRKWAAWIEARQKRDNQRRQPPPPSVTPKQN